MLIVLRILDGGHAKILHLGGVPRQINALASLYAANPRRRVDRPDDEASFVGGLASSDFSSDTVGDSAIFRCFSRIVLLIAGMVECQTKARCRLMLGPEPFTKAVRTWTHGEEYDYRISPSTSAVTLLVLLIPICALG